MQVFPHVLSFIESVRNEKIKNPETKSYGTVVELCFEPFTVGKLAFVLPIARPVEEFLKKFQSDKPLIPFLYKELEALIRSRFHRKMFVNGQFLNSD